MNKEEKEEIIYTKEKMATFVKISEECLTDIHVKVGEVFDDMLRNQITAHAERYFYTNTREERVLTYQVEAPTFWDWLFRREKTVYFDLSVKDVLKNPPKESNAYRIVTVKERQ